jgi:hypothetical protein
VTRCVNLENGIFFIDFGKVVEKFYNFYNFVVDVRVYILYIPNNNDLMKGKQMLNKELGHLAKFSSLSREDLDCLDGLCASGKIKVPSRRIGRKGFSVMLEHHIKDWVRKAKKKDGGI